MRVYHCSGEWVDDGDGWIGAAVEWCVEVAGAIVAGWALAVVLVAVWAAVERTGG